MSNLRGRQLLGAEDNEVSRENYHISTRLQEDGTMKQQINYAATAEVNRGYGPPLRIMGQDDDDDDDDDDDRRY